MVWHSHKAIDIFEGVQTIPNAHGLTTAYTLAIVMGQWFEWMRCHSAIAPSRSLKRTLNSPLCTESIASTCSILTNTTVHKPLYY
ncbi:hypothetical protein BDV3_002759 [Batrachochytrium dendrobatidis]